MGPGPGMPAACATLLVAGGEEAGVGVAGGVVEIDLLDELRRQLAFDEDDVLAKPPEE